MREIIPVAESIGLKVEGFCSCPKKKVMSILLEGNKVALITYHEENGDFCEGSYRINGEDKVELGVMSPEEYDEKKKTFDDLKDDFLTSHDRILQKANEIGW